ncbi:MAG TPA: hypothetical protein VM120_18425 [Bryobacteraceae bacterium]|nr:hypothetical protein [Bryobacteraceae bacterium]
MPRPPRLTPKKARAQYRSLQSAWRFALNMEPPNWQALEQIEQRLKDLEAKGFDRPPKEQGDLEVE